jgi:hypothetical protein
MYKKNRKTRALHEGKAVEWDAKTEDLSFKLHPLNRTEGRVRSYFPCGHSIRFPTRDCHKKERQEMQDKDLILEYEQNYKQYN